MAEIETGSSVSGRVNVNSTFQARTGLDNISTRNGKLAIAGRLPRVADAILDIDVRCDTDYRLRVGTDSVLAKYTVPNQSQWSLVSASMSGLFSGTRLLLNNTSVLTAAARYTAQTYAAFPVFYGYRTRVTLPFRIIASNLGIINQGWDFGLALGASVVSAPTDGVRLSMAPTGLLTFEAYFDSGAATPVIVDYSGIATTVWHVAEFDIDDSVLRLRIDNVLLAEIERPPSSSIFSAGALPFYARVYNGVTSPLQVTQMEISSVTVSVLGMQNALTAMEASLLYGLESGSGQQGQPVSGSLSRTVAAGTAPAVAVPTNTTAALGVGFGGDYLSTNTLAVDTYGIISTYVAGNPNASASSNRSLLVTSVVISTTVQAALTNAGAANYIWAVSFGQRSVSLATVESATSRAPVMMTVGQQTAIGNAVAGTQLQNITAECNFVVRSGEYIQVAMKNGGTVGGGGTLSHTIHFSGRWI